MLKVDCPVDEGVCCVEMFGFANNVLTVVYNDLLDCYEAGPEDPLVAYVTMGGGDDGIYDGLSVRVLRIKPSIGSALNGTQFGPVLIRGTFEVRLLESGWPTVSVNGTTVILPEPTEQHEAARQALAHGEAVYRSLLRHRRDGSFIEGLTALGGAQIDIGDLEPITPLGGVIGWRVSVVVDLPWGGG